MHVYLREEPVDIEIREVDPEGLVGEEGGLIPVAFYVSGNERPSFRAILPPETLAVLEEATLEPVRLGLLSEEPEDGGEFQAMVGLALTLSGEGLEGLGEEDGEASDEAPAEPWRADPDAWKSDNVLEEAEGERTVLLAFAPLIRLKRKFPDDFSEELADLLESALSGSTRPALEARVDRMLEDL